MYITLISISIYTAYFGGYIYENYLQTFEALDLGPEHAYIIAKNSLEGSFVDDDVKKKWIERLDECFIRFGAVRIER